MPHRPPAADTAAPFDTHAAVRTYYGEVLSSSADLKTDACKIGDVDPRMARLIANVHPEISERFYGCGVIAPGALLGRRVLDLGCGSGRDVYVLSQLVGERGEVVGVDMTPEQLAVAERWRDWHRAAFGHARSNVRFELGMLETLCVMPLAPESFDVAVSNCVINLTADKGAVLTGLARLLAAGGEFHLSDVYVDRPLSPAARRDPELYGECLSGALEWREFAALADAAGFAAPRIVSARPLTVEGDCAIEKLDGARFISATVRLFKRPEPHGPARAVYHGGLLGEEDAFALDADTRFDRGVAQDVDADTAAILAGSRFASAFDLAPIAAASAAPRRDPFALADASKTSAAPCCG